ncbi:cytochrome P450 [Annulohypoxylon maeteangense]|uniref:cytochrome P450 n=1 Tax=Annulohypoxylon maeteangense TaxID=1927788 RepID=UPI00200886DA|nr:cytochrome P450 [Annulohypoxylon maeteangense]KAI0880050.1 cytochrome P450 [Annulohypoxylon maeteangense]
MAPAVTIALGGIAATYLFLRFLLYLTQDAREPPAIETEIPFFGPLIGMFREKSHFYLRLRDTYKLPIYTLRMPFSRMYIVNATGLIPELQKQWRTISFAAIAADAGNLVGMSKEAIKTMHQDLTSENGFSASWPKYITPVMGPGADLDAINRRSIEVFSTDMENLRAQGTVQVGLWQWSRRIMVESTTEAVWGPQNPYRDPAIAEAWKTFEAGFLTLSVFPFASLLFPKLVQARELVADAMLNYMRKGGHEKASGLVRKRLEHHQQLFGLSLEDVARGELGNTFAVLGNTTPCALWVLYHIFSDEQVLTDIRREVSALVHEEEDEENGIINTVDLAGIRESCPILLSTFQETLRHRAVNPGPRVLLEDVLLDGRILLKKGSMLMIPAPVQHTDTAAWGEDAREFDHLRFVRKLAPGHKKPNRVAFRAFGGGHVLCPGRHFASTEIMALATLLVLQFDVTPVTGRWDEPTWENSPVQAGFPVPDEDINVELRPRDPARKWHVKFTGSDKAMGIVAEDSIPDKSSI